MQYTGIYQQQKSNNFKSLLLLLAFPILVLACVYAFFLYNYPGHYNLAFEYFLQAAPTVLIFVLIWFIIAYFGNTLMIKYATKSTSLSRKENMRVYNLVENLCISQGMQMPKINVIETNALNAFASGINKNTYSITLTRGIIEELNDEELEGVIAHELMHIKNHDVRLLIISIIFVGIFSFVVQVAFRSLLFGGGNRKNKKDNGKAMLVILLISAVAYLISLLFKFALSRKREYMADAGAAEMTKNPRALANALRKISGNSKVEDVQGDVQQMFISNESSLEFLGGLSGLFATHPPIEKRIQVLEQF
jgi:heat shock protein HtpX